jgi:lysyl-tRNA synthetase class II
MLPSVRFPFSDGEQRARMRYLDMLWNDRSRQVLWQRSRMVRYIRDCECCVRLACGWAWLTGDSLP